MRSGPAGGFFGDAGAAFTAFEFLGDRGPVDTGRVQHDGEVVEHVGGLAGEGGAIALRRGDDGLDGLFAEFLGAFGRPFRE